jgi:hypothetical protein
MAVGAPPFVGLSRGRLGATPLAAAGLGGMLYFTGGVVLQGILSAVAPLGDPGALARAQRGCQILAARPSRRVWRRRPHCGGRVKIRDEGLVRNKAVHFALGVRADGSKAMQVWPVASGNTAVIASGKPLRPSTTAINTSSTPRFFGSLSETWLDREVFANMASWITMLDMPKKNLWG